MAVHSRVCSLSRREVPLPRLGTAAAARARARGSGLRASLLYLSYISTCARVDQSSAMRRSSHTATSSVCCCLLVNPRRATAREGRCDEHWAGQGRAWAGWTSHLQARGSPLLEGGGQRLGPCSPRPQSGCSRGERASRAAALPPLCRGRRPAPCALCLWQVRGSCLWYSLSRPYF